MPASPPPGRFPGARRALRGVLVGHLSTSRRHIFMAPLLNGAFPTGTKLLAPVRAPPGALFKTLISMSAQCFGLRYHKRLKNHCFF